MALKSTYNPRTRKYYGFCDSYVPDPINFRKDLWDEVGMGARMGSTDYLSQKGIGVIPLEEGVRRFLQVCQQDQSFISHFKDNLPSPSR